MGLDFEGVERVGLMIGGRKRIHSEGCVMKIFAVKRLWGHCYGMAPLTKYKEKIFNALSLNT